MISLNKIVIAVTATVLMTPVPALAEWVEVTGTRNKTDYVDTGSIVKDNDTVKYWQRTHSSTSNSDGATVMQSQVVGNCATGEWGILHIIGFNRNGSRVSDVQLPANKMIFQGSVVPGTIVAALHEFAC